MTTSCNKNNAYPLKKKKKKEIVTEPEVNIVQYILLKKIFNQFK